MDYDINNYNITNDEYTIIKTNSNQLLQCILYVIIKDSKITNDKIKTTIKQMEIWYSNNKIDINTFKNYNKRIKNEYICNLCKCKSMLI